VRVEKLETVDGGTFKIVELTREDGPKGGAELLERTARHLAAFGGSAAVPELVYLDARRLIVRWIPGLPLSERELDEDAIEELGTFVGRNVRDIISRPAETECAIVRERYEGIRALGLVDPDIHSRIDALLARFSEAASLVHDAVCLSDVALKNFLKDAGGKLHYVDVFGITRQPVGRALAKHLRERSPLFRRAFSRGFLRSPACQSVRLNMTVGYLSHIVGRISAKANKKTLMQRIYARGKARKGIDRLREFLDHSESEESVRCWLFGACPT